MPILHKKASVAPNNPSKEISSDAWNDSHTNPDIGDVNGLTSALAGKYDASNPSGFVGASEVSAAQSFAIQRANHTGTQVASTISDFASTVRSTSLLGFVSSAGTVSDTDTILQAIQKIVGNIAALVTGVSSVAGKTGAVTLAKGDVGLGNVDNTSDANKPISNATQIALNGKEATIDAGTTGQYWRGDKTWQPLNKAAVGLSNVDNTSDLNKPISTATQAALDAINSDIGTIYDALPVTGSVVADFGSSASGGTNEVVLYVSSGDVKDTDKPVAFFAGLDTPDHSVNDHIYASLFCTLVCGVPVTGDGFEIYIYSTEKLTGTFNINWKY